METGISQHFGEVSLRAAGERSVTGRGDYDGALVTMDLALGEHDRLDEAALHKVDYKLRYLPELIEQIRERILQELEDESSAVSQFRHFHCREVSEAALSEVFGVRSVAELDAPDVFARALRLHHVRVFPGQPERYLVLDFTLGHGFTDETLIAAADEDGLIDDEIVWS